MFDKRRQMVCLASSYLLVLRDICGLYYKHTMLINYTSSIVNKLEALLTDDTRVVIYDRHVFIVQATGG
jgi:hypothetical protein